MVKISKILILILVISGLVGFGLAGQIFKSSAQEAKPLEVAEKKLPKRVDKDKNKIFDDLEELLKVQPDEAFFNTIILFEEALSDALFEKAKGKIGDFSIKYQYSSISGIAAALTKGQIIALSRIPFIKQIEYDAKVKKILPKKRIEITITLYAFKQKGYHDYWIITCDPKTGEGIVAVGAEHELLDKVKKKLVVD